MTTYGIEVRQRNGTYLAASQGRSREYAESAFSQYVATGECCRIVDSEGEVIEATPEPPPRSNVVDLSNTRVIVTAWPDMKWPVELVTWLEQTFRDVPTRDDFKTSLKKKDRTCARNTAIRDVALGSDYEWFIFVDSDVRPHPVHSRRFLELDSDVKCCEVPMRTPTAWSWPHAFHESFWCTHRKVLEAIPGPWFMQQYNADGTEMAGCICKFFRRKVLAAGFTISHGGWADHDLEGSWC